MGIATGRRDVEIFRVITKEAEIINIHHRQQDLRGLAKMNPEIRKDVVQYDEHTRMRFMALLTAL